MNTWEGYGDGMLTSAYNYFTAPTPADTLGTAQRNVGRALQNVKLTTLDGTDAATLLSATPVSDAEAYARASALLAIGSMLLAGTSQGRGLASTAMGYLGRARTEYGTPGWENRKGHIISIYSACAAVLRTQAISQRLVLYLADQMLRRVSTTAGGQHTAVATTTAPPPPGYIVQTPATDAGVTATPALVPSVNAPAPASRRPWIGPLVFVFVSVGGILAWRYFRGRK
jgi:hypothetical protein